MRRIGVVCAAADTLARLIRLNAAGRRTGEESAVTDSPTPPQAAPPRRVFGLTRGRLIAVMAVAALVCCALPVAVAGTVLSGRAKTEVLTCDTGGPVATMTYTVTNRGLLSADVDILVQVTGADGAVLGQSTERVPNLHAGATVTKDTALRYREGTRATHCVVEPMN
ncbi:hypothetical protein Cs7R123_17820 [Catellatospora sp. TT07R-123]|uniref:hypothetical protein n=1 Tax=Catellatospora sp. TT07R-123 TaxID=2733863 RepID=UPI001B22F603|nr:hypothetical protein [Catellatospora sp. TT07R-123]GHJ44440.1 hypothetical protein Cs7R123_17820 [Catellatospora sp. TT07R-123]